jgi:hypothetical protein
MDDIWRKAAKNLHKREEHVSGIRTGPETKPAAIAATTATPAYPILNTVAQCDARLLQMEFEWKLNRSGPFPDGIRTAIANLRAALVIREAEASQQATYETTTTTVSAPADTAAATIYKTTTATIPAPTNAATPTTTSTPANTAAPAAYGTTTTRERLDRVTDARHVTAQLETDSIEPTLDSTARIATPATTPTLAPTLSPAQTTATDPSSNAAAEFTAVVTRMTVEQRSTKQPDNEENGESTEGEEDERQQRREKEGKGVEKEDRARE